MEIGKRYKPGFVFSPKKPVIKLLPVYHWSRRCPQIPLLTLIPIRKTSSVTKDHGYDSGSIHIQVSNTTFSSKSISFLQFSFKKESNQF